MLQNKTNVTLQVPPECADRIQRLVSFLIEKEVKGEGALQAALIDAACMLLNSIKELESHARDSLQERYLADKREHQRTLEKFFAFFPLGESPIKGGTKEDVSIQDKSQNSPYSMFDVCDLTDQKLLDYLHNERGINEAVAKQFCKEVHYSFKDKPWKLSAIAYPNNVGGYELKGLPYKNNPIGFVGAKAPKGITVHLYEGCTSFVVFDGFIDMLSFYQMDGGAKHNYVVLNGTVNVGAAISYLQKHSSCTIFLCLSNDEAGTKTTHKIKTALPRSVDVRNRILPHRNVNEWFLSKKEHEG